MGIPSYLRPFLASILTYYLVRRFFPEKLPDKNFKEDLRGGDLVKDSLLNDLFKKLTSNKALKFALISLFVAAGVESFKDEIKTLLIDDVFKELCTKKVKGELKIVCDIVKEHELNLHAKSIRKLIIFESISRENKISLLKIKLDYIINDECTGKKRFLVATLIAALITLCLSGIGGLALFMEALYQLFKEGKISRAVYEQILKIMAKGTTNVPIEQL